jgi:hypothetical protein
MLIKPNIPFILCKYQEFITRFVFLIYFLGMFLKTKIMI